MCAHFKSENHKEFLPTTHGSVRGGHVFSLSVRSQGGGGGVTPTMDRGIPSSPTRHGAGLGGGVISQQK